MNEKIEKAIIILTALVCVIIPILDFIGALDSISFIYERIHIMTMLSIGVLILFLYITLTRVENKTQNQTKEILDKIILDENNEKIINTVKGIWQKRESDIETFFKQIFNDKSIQDHDSLRKYLSAKYRGITTGDFINTKMPHPLDFTISAINLNGDFIYNPDERKILTRAISKYPYSKIMNLKTGQLLSVDSERSEQLNINIGRRAKGERLSKLYFQYFDKLKAIVIFEYHINLIYRLRQIDLTNDFRPPFTKKIVEIDTSIPTSFEILEGIYRSKNNEFDVTEKLIKNINNNTLNIIASNEIFGDPSPGYIKHLIIKYKINGIIISATYQESEQIILP